jgi:hypothetical protein
MKSIVVLACVLLFITPVISNDVVKISSAHDTEDLPPSFSWRNVNGTDYTTPIRDQAPAPTCEAFGLCTALETEMQYQLKERYLPDLSENHLYFNAGGTIEKGWVSLIDAANYLMQYGVPDEGCFPDPHRDFDYPYYSLPGWENRTVKISEWGWVDYTNITAMKRALIDHGPLIICIHFWADFFITPGKIYRHHLGRPVGGHVVAIVGYDDNESCWIVKNSWGTRWGQEGWFKMAYNADMISQWYGGTGVMYVDGVYGNLKPDVPKVHIEAPIYYHTYLAGRGFETVVKRALPQLAAARVIGKMNVSVQAENTVQVEFFVDNVSQYVDTNAPFSWELQTSPGLHTLLVKATSASGNVSIDVEDFYDIF